VILNCSVTFPAREREFYQISLSPGADQALLQLQMEKTALGEEESPAG
jgi:hypothetical protein